MRMAAGPPSNQAPCVVRASRCPACARTALPSSFTGPLSGVYAQPLLGCIGQTQHPFATYHKTTFYTRACKALPSTNFPFTMRYWPIANGSSRLIVTEQRRHTSNGTARHRPDRTSRGRSGTMCATTCCGMGGGRQPRSSACPATPSGASSNGATWGTPCHPCPELRQWEPNGA